MAVEYEEFISFINDNKLYLTEKEFVKFEIGEKICVIPYNYIQFLFYEYAKKYNIKPNKVYKPKNFFKRFKYYFTLLEDIKYKKEYVMTSKGMEKKDVTCYPVKAKTFESKDKFEAALFKIKGYTHLAWGSGDGYSRFILCENIDKLPNFYFEEPKMIK